MNANSLIGFRPPIWLKRGLVPIWNGGHQLAYSLVDRFRAIVHGRVECRNVCGRFGLMIYRRRVIVPELVRRWGLSEPLAQAVARKESLECSRCGAKLRARRLAQTLLDLYPVQPPARSLAAWARSDAASRLRVAEINQIEGVHHALTGLPHFAPSDHTEGATPGTSVNGIRHEDLSRLTYADAAFDLILTSETLEHVPRLDQALAEIQRVLAPGGRHLFTIPLLPHVQQTFTRTLLQDDGTLIELHAPIRHPGGDSGWLVHTEFGADLPAVLANAGFEVEVRFGPPTTDDVAQVFVTRKPAQF